MPSLKVSVWEPVYHLPPIRLLLLPAYIISIAMMSSGSGTLRDDRRDEYILANLSRHDELRTWKRSVSTEDHDERCSSCVLRSSWFRRPEARPKADALILLLRTRLESSMKKNTTTNHRQASAVSVSRSQLCWRCVWTISIINVSFGFDRWLMLPFWGRGYRCRWRRWSWWSRRRDVRARRKPPTACSRWLFLLIANGCA